MTKDWVQKQLANGLADFKGLSIDASVPLRDTLVNELITGALRAAGAPAVAAPSTGGPDIRPLLRFIEKAQVRTAEGTMVLDVAVRVR